MQLTAVRLLVSVLLLVQFAAASLISIDYGNDFFKVGMLKTGSGMDLVLNAESKRKSPSIIAFKGTERLFGTSALNAATRDPKRAFADIKEVLATKFASDAAQSYRNANGNEMRSSPIGGETLLMFNETLSVRPEVLLAMQLRHMRDMAEAAGGEKVEGAVITVPAYYDQSQRTAMLQAAEIAGVRVLQLMNDVTAVALNFAMGVVTSTKLNKNPEYYVVFDMGAASTVVSVISIAEVSTKAGFRTKMVPQVDVRATASDFALGGRDFDHALCEILITRFLKANSKQKESDLRDSARAMAKIRKEANRIKGILGINEFVDARVESLFDDLDLRARITKEEFEKVCDSLYTRVLAPVRDAVKSANLDPKDIKSILLHGGSSRLPRVQSDLAKFVGGEEKIAKRVNADEAATLGAVYKAASLSSTARVKEIGIKDIAPSPVSLTYTSDDGKIVNLVLYKESSNLGSTKKVRFKQKIDFDFEISISHGRKIAKVHVANVTETIAKYESKNLIEEPKIKVTFQLDESGVLQINGGSIFFEWTKTEQKTKGLLDNITSLFGGANDVEDDKDQFQDDSSSSSSNIVPESVNNVTETGKNDTEIKGSEKESKTEKLPVIVEWLDIQPLTDEEKDQAKSLISEFDASDELRIAHEGVKNGLESFIYKMQDFFERDSVIEATREDQRQAFIKTLHVARDWFDENMDTCTTELIEAKLQHLNETSWAMRTHIADRELLHEAFPKVQIELERAFESMNKTLAVTVPSYGEYVHEEERGEVTDMLQKLRAEIESITASAADFAKADPRDILKMTANTLNAKAKQLTMQARDLSGRLGRLWESKKRDALAEIKRKAAEAKAAAEAAASKLNSTAEESGDNVETSVENDAETHKRDEL